ncbi:MAG: helix-turn-helix domain-containing protein [Solirubrobacterales bacterium]|nr:helix-turn-helix domain-containing protein [Solirubrobacterales bacterium]
MSGESEQREFLTVRDVADLLQLNEQTVRNWIDQGSLPAHRIGRRVRIQRSDLDQILNASKTAANGTTPTNAPAGPNGDDFWGGETVGEADLAPESNR